MCLVKKEMYIFFVQCMVIWLKAIESGPYLYDLYNLTTMLIDHILASIPLIVSKKGIINVINQ